MKCEIPIYIKNAAHFAQGKIPSTVVYNRYGEDNLVAGFWWAFAQAIRLQQDSPGAQADRIVDEFEELALHAIANVKVGFMNAGIRLQMQLPTCTYM